VRHPALIPVVEMPRHRADFLGGTAPEIRVLERG
jgi:hypothetical protein